MGMIDDAKEVVGETSKNISEVISERVFKPMYFYFIISWVVVNWKFVFILLFTDARLIIENKEVLKSEYLSNMYAWDFESIAQLLLIPALSSFVFVWWLSKASAKFFEKNEEHKQEVITIKNRVVYAAKVSYAAEQRKIRDLESDKKELSYLDNPNFNEFIDETNDTHEIAGVQFLASEVLYNNDYEVYKVALEEFLADPEREETRADT